MPIEKTVAVTTTVTEYRISGAEILSLIPPLKPGDEAKVEFGVPRGGDYSGMKVPVDETYPVFVTVTRRGGDHA
jgi:hypothetical protein